MVSPAVDPALIADLVARALAEDVGTGDLTSAATVPPGTRATARVRQKAPGVIYGLAAAAEAFRQTDPGAAFTTLVEEGVWREDGPVFEVAGDAAALLAAERTALNILGRLSGVATMAARYVREVDGTGATILDTRKTTPGLRLLEKAAVVAGGASNHRIGLFDAVLIKENHSAMAGGVGAAVRAARAHAGDGVLVEAEVRNLAEVDEALEAGAPRVLLDNMSVAQLRAAVQHIAGAAETEASGNVNLDTVRAIAQTGVQFISVGALTHSAPTLDLSLILTPEKAR
ncbi:Nicotinate-nucleotide pyrophosphorylase [carboxylating] [Paraconexibacter sp. AEG42_29]|uniref:Nicotinate-nucleotide pyrophosphorylase [carboxylating] n=1 Tax=Paraconexibacter sp. AEG42_29 TaxID=2997339 RepID=A0AAU7ASW5_9ACTN